MLLCIEKFWLGASGQITLYYA